MGNLKVQVGDFVRNGTLEGGHVVCKPVIAGCLMQAVLQHFRRQEYHVGLM